jgi:hypothetical protein
MVMWELMTGKRPFWDLNHDVNLVIDICDGVRPSIVTNAPEGYIELMQECWRHDPKRRPIASDIESKIRNILLIESDNCYDNNPTKIIKSLGIGPVTINSPGFICEGGPLDAEVVSAETTKSFTEIGK